jgi:23S rRNA (adenine2030-N6)-methyltransferase
MNYRHAFHAGNFADVLKHAVLARILVHLRTKPAAFRVLDTHAGAGLYDLAGAEASRGGEWRAGIGRLLGAFSGEVEAGSAQKMRPTQETSSPIGEGARALLADYLRAVAAVGGADRLAAYPGSPLLVRALLRPQDRLTACELEPNAAAALARHLRGDARCKAVAIDGWTALNAYLPPKERRGLVLIDPPFEDPGDFTRLAHALEAAYRKWASGSYLAWYPIKARAEPDALARRLRRSGMAKVLRAELSVAAPRDGERLASCGLIVVNPPWTLAGELAVLLPELATALAGVDGAHRVDMLGEK